MGRAKAAVSKPQPMVEETIPLGGGDKFALSLGVAADRTYRYFIAPGFQTAFDQTETAEYEHAGVKFAAPDSIPSCVQLPHAPKKCDDPAALFERTRDLILGAGQVDCTPEDAMLVTAYVFFTYLGDGLPAHPVMFVLGEPGSGKSHLADVLQHLVRRPARFTISSTFAAARNVIHLFAPTLLLEEAAPRGRGSEVDAEWYRAVCDATTNPTGTILRADPEDIGKVHEFRFGGPKIIFSTAPWADKAFNRRTTEIVMQTTARNIRPLLSSEFCTEASDIAAQLHYLRLMCLVQGSHDPVAALDQVNDDLFELGLRAGGKQFNASLGAVLKAAAAPKYYAVYMNAARRRESDKVAERADSFTGKIVGVIFNMRQRPGFGEVSPKEVALAVDGLEEEESGREPLRTASAAMVGRTLKTLGFRSHRTRDKNLWVAPSEAKLQALFAKYIVSAEPASDVLSPQTSLATQVGGKTSFHPSGAEPPAAADKPEGHGVEGVEGAEAGLGLTVEEMLAESRVYDLAAMNFASADDVRARVGLRGERALGRLLSDGRVVVGDDGHLRLGLPGAHGPDGLRAPTDGPDHDEGEAYLW
jgi:hypothetical protein